MARATCTAKHLHIFLGCRRRRFCIAVVAHTVCKPQIINTDHARLVHHGFQLTLDVEEVLVVLGNFALPAGINIGANQTCLCDGTGTCDIAAWIPRFNSTTTSNSTTRL
jgi:hypothetical protein